MSLEGYASATSVPQGGTIAFQINSSPPSSFQMNIVKVGLSETQVLSTSGSAASYSTPADAYATGCGWPTAYTLQIPTTWSSGLYRADIIAGTGTIGIHFVVRAAQPGSTSKILFQLAINTYEAYNTSEGKSLYGSLSNPYEIAERARMVSFDRPPDPDRYNDELPFLRWMEQNGLPCEFCTSVDLHTGDAAIGNYYLLLSVGHDEYWSKEMRDNVETFVANGGNMAFFSGNVCWWQVRFENDNRIMVCYKSADEDPLTGVDDSRVTVNWYAPPVNRPENSMTGVSFRNGAGNWINPVPQPGYTVQFAQHWVFDGTGLNMGNTFGVGVVGYETDAALYTLQDGVPQVTGQDGTPLNFQVLATADLSDWGPHGQAGMATMGIFQNTGTVFTAATTGWSALLQNPIVSRITRNVVERLVNLHPPDLWEQIGHANSVTAMAGSGAKLFAATSDNQLWWRDPLGINIGWQAIGTAHNVVAMAALNGKLFAAASGNTLWWRDAVGQDVPWQAIGTANNAVAMAALNGKLFAATSDNTLWWRDAVGQDVPWQAIGTANNVVAMAALNGKLFAATSGDNTLWWRDAVGQNIPWQAIGRASNVAAMAALNEMLFAATKDNKLWWRKSTPAT